MFAERDLNAKVIAIRKVDFETILDIEARRSAFIPY
jgi:hypothetical protein